MNHRYNGILIWIVTALLISGVGCTTTPPPTFYQLEEPASNMLSGLDRGIAIGVGPINLAGYLDRPQVVTRKTDHELDLSEFNRWAEPLKDSVTRVIIVNLSNMLGTTRIYAISRRNIDIPLAYRVEIDIPRFDGKLGGDALLVARWTLYGKDDKALTTRVSIIRDPSGGEGYDKLIAAYNRTLKALSLEIGARIKAYL